jgi:MFS family permease
VVVDTVDGPGRLDRIAVAASLEDSQERSRSHRVGPTGMGRSLPSILLGRHIDGLAHNWCEPGALLRSRRDGGGFGSWLVTRLGTDSEDEEARQGFALTGMAGGLGGGYSAPLFAAVLASELSPTSKRNYVAAFIPELLAATLGFVIYSGVTGSSMLGSYRLPEYDLQVMHLIVGALLGVAAVFVLLLHTYIGKLVSAAAARIANPYSAGHVPRPRPSEWVGQRPSPRRVCRAGSRDMIPIGGYHG